MVKVRLIGCLTITDRSECLPFSDIRYKFFNFHMENKDNQFRTIARLLPRFKA
jgi:hypothetical protein